jgi:hypothetical protein
LPHQGDLRRGQGVGVVDEVTECALQGEDFGGESAGGLDSAGVFVSQRVKAGGEQRLFLATGVVRLSPCAPCATFVDCHREHNFHK